MSDEKKNDIDVASARPVGGNRGLSPDVPADVPDVPDVDQEKLKVTGIGSDKKYPESLLPAGILLTIFFPGLFFVADIAFFLKLFVLLVIWWGLLFFFWISPVFCFFEAERNWYAQVKKITGSPAIKGLMAGSYLLFFWPICIPKQVCFYLFVVFGISIVAAKKYYF